VDFIDQIRQLASRLPNQRDHIKTEEATKMALIAPFIAALGYDVFNPAEVEPEMVADIGTKKGEKVDYAIKIGGMPCMLFECKSLNEHLDAHNSQLFRYFSCIPSARIGVLTNGITYQFFSDLEAPNRMDTKPFLIFSLADVQPEACEQLKKLTKSAFNMEEMLTAAQEMKLLREIKRVLAAEYAAPSEEFVRFIASQVHQGRVTQSVRESLEPVLRSAFRQFVAELINARLKTAMANESPARDDAPKTEGEAGPELTTEEAKLAARGVVTTDDELEAFRIVRAIVCGVVDVSRVVYRDSKSYFSVLLDDTNRKPICRLYLNSENTRYVGVFDAAKNETRKPLVSLNDLYAHAAILRTTVADYDKAEGEKRPTGAGGEVSAPDA
jgi:hypothetical protein